MLQAASPERARDAAAGCGPRPGQTGRGAQATGDGTGSRAALRRGLARPMHLGDGGEQGFATVELGRAAARRPGSVARCGSPSGSSVAVPPPRRFLSSALLHGGPAGSSARYSGTGWPSAAARVALACGAYFLPPRPRVPLSVAVRPTSFLPTTPPTRRGYYLIRVRVVCGLRSACICETATGSCAYVL